MTNALRERVVGSSVAKGISQATLEHKIKETIRQIGARVVEEGME